jgi:anti-sigma factor RsiW
MTPGPGDSAEMIARDATYHRASEDLRKRVGAALAREAGESRKPFLWHLFGTALACAAVAVLTWSLALTTLLPGGDERIAQEIVTAHVRSLMAPNHLADVVSTDQHTVKPWFTGKLDFAPPVADYAASGFTLTGGRLDYVDGRAAAAITYRHRLHVVNVFVWPAAGEADRTPHTHARQGYSLVGWTRGGLRFCAVGDVAAADLGVLVDLLRDKA